MSVRIPIVVRMSRPLLAKLQKRYRMPDMGNAFDELVARSLTMESARQIQHLRPAVQDADVAKEHYDLDPNWMSMNSMKSIPEFKLKIECRILDQLAEASPFKTACGGRYADIFRLMLERGLWGETTDDARPQMVKGFGDVGGILPISWKDAEDKMDVLLG